MAEATLTREGPAAASSGVPDWGEVQRVLLRGYQKLPWAHFLFLRVTDPSLAAKWLQGLLEHGPLKFGWGQGHESASAAVAFTREGLSVVGVDDATIEGFSPEFVDGMTASMRARKLGDAGDSAPDHWLWGGEGNRVHVVLQLYADSQASIEHAVISHRALLAPGGLVEVRGIDGSDLGASRPLVDRREHFGFADGISQPRFRDEPLGVRSGARDADRLAAGELLLGYPNEAHIMPRSPALSAKAKHPSELHAPDQDLGRNGSYLVVRQLEQDVGGFWRAMALARAGADASVEDRVWLAAKMVGRWPDGSPLVTRPERDGPRAAAPEEFDFARDDPHGERCPFGAHIRRANPRAGLARDPDVGLAKSKKHRILRRGRPYGAPFVDSMIPEDLVAAAVGGTGRPGPRGLHFLCFNADLANQFEFVQQTWANGPVFAGLHGEVDPLIGDPTPTGGLFSIPSDPCRRVRGLPRFVQVRGGAYFFAPSRATLFYLSRIS